MRGFAIICISFIVFVLLSTAPVLAYTGSITASPSSGSSITNKMCGSTTAVQVNIQNSGGGMALCWYRTDKSYNNWVRGTPSCVPSGSGTTSFNANIEMPQLGSETRTLYVQCNDYWGLSNCGSSTQYDSPNQCSPVSTSCYSSLSQTFTYAVSCSPPKFTIAPDKPSLTLSCGSPSTTVSINMQSQDTDVLQCLYRINDGSTTNIDVPLIAGGAYSFSIPIGFPSPCTNQQVNYKVDVVCSDPISNLPNTQSTSITVSYTVDPCVAALAGATSAISDAQTAISNAQSKIQEANNVGADVTTAQASLNQANTDFTTAQSSLSTAQSTCNSGDKATGASQANSAQTSANQAQTEATSALNAAQQAVITFQQKKTDASNEISGANSKIDSAAGMINNADNVLQNATALNTALPEALGGLDLVSQKSNIATARAKLDQARQYIQDAQTAFDQKNFDLAKSKADSALQLANDGNSLATDSFTKINTVMGTLGIAANNYLAASSEISQTDSILTKMDYVISSVEKWGVNLADAKQITSDGKSSIDQAKDLLSQAKDRLQAGASDDASSKAIAARDQAAEPANRLNRIVSSINTQTESAMEKALSDASGKISSAEANVNGAAGTYMATQSEVIAAQNDLTSAKSSLSNATSASKDAAQATDLSSFLDKASVTFSAIEQLQSQVQSADTHANNAKLGLYTTAGGAGVVAAGAAGGGFLFWKKKRKSQPAAESAKKKAQDEHTEKTEKPADKIGKTKGNFCGNCGMSVEQSVRFCPRCGKRI